MLFQKKVINFIDDLITYLLNNLCAVYVAIMKSVPIYDAPVREINDYERVFYCETKIRIVIYHNIEIINFWTHFTQYFIIRAASENSRFKKIDYIDKSIRIHYQPKNTQVSFTTHLICFLTKQNLYLIRIDENTNFSL